MFNICTSAEFTCNPGAPESSIEQLQRLYAALPGDYIEWLRQTNGGEGFAGENYLILWRAEELEDFNREYEVGEYAPGLILIGSTGGGEAYAFDTRETGWPVVRVPFIGMSLKYAIRVGGTFSDFLASLATNPGH